MIPGRWRWLGLAVGVWGCGGPPASVVPASLDVEWQPFRWADLTVGGVEVRRAAILIETADRALIARGDTAVTQFQLDFGFSGTGAFGIPLRALEPESTDLTTARTSFRAVVSRLGNRDDSAGVRRPYRLGTVGLLYYGLKGLIIDQAGHRVGAPRTGAALPPELEQRMRWTPATETVGRLVVPLTTGTDRLGGLWFDPGSSLVPLLVDDPTWRLLTGASGRDGGLRRLAFPTATDSLILEGAPSRVPMSLGTIPLGTTTVWRVVSGPPAERPDRFPDGVVGVIGNQLFESWSLVYVNVRAKRLGVVR